LSARGATVDQPNLDDRSLLHYCLPLAGRGNSRLFGSLDFTSEERKGLLVNVTVENLAPCKKLMRVEIEPQKVDEAFDTMTKQFQREASLPGFRPGLHLSAGKLSMHH